MAEDLIGKYLRLRRELLETDRSTPLRVLHRRRVAHDLAQLGAELQASKPDKAPFLDTLPWSDTLL